MNWFQKLTGLVQESPENVRQHLSACDGVLKSNINGAAHRYGQLEVISLRELRDRVAGLECGDFSKTSTPKISIKEIVADVLDLHRDEKNRNAIFQCCVQTLACSTAKRLGICFVCRPFSVRYLLVYMSTVSV